MSPGSAIAVGKRQLSDKTWISTTRYNVDKIEELTDVPLDQIGPDVPPTENLWINVDGVHDPELVQRIGQKFNLHALSIEDIVNTQIRPKQEDYGSYLVVMLRMILRTDKKAKGAKCFSTEHVAIILGQNWVITFQEQHSADVFEPIRTRLRGAMGKIRSCGADYLAYAIIDAIVDGYFEVLEELGEELEELESQVTNPESSPMLTEIHSTRNFGLFLRRYVWPVRDVLAGIERNESPLIQKSTRIFLRDVYDHAIEIMEMLEAYREMASGLMDLHLSAMSNRMNSVMMVLTTVTTIFMPLTFIAGVYGMNFTFMPELKWHYGYPSILLVMLSISLGMLVFFRRRRWI